MDISITSRNRLALRIDDDEADEDDDDYTGVYSMPCRPCNPSLFNIQCTRLPANYPMPRPENNVSLLTDRLAMDYFELELYASRSVNQHRVHAGVFAVVEFYNSSMMDSFNGIYFFTTAAPQRMLRHIQPAPFPYEMETDMCFLPMEMWLLADHGIWYFGPHHDDDTQMLHLARPNEKIAPALWFAYYGRGPEALAYMKDRSIGINSCDLAKDKTVLHYAAMGGDVHTIHALISAGSNIEAEDTLHETPLCSAARWLKADAIRALLWVGAKVSDKIFSLIGDTHTEDRLTDEDDMCDTISALLDNTDSTHHHLMFFNVDVMQHPAAMQLLIQRGVPTNKRLNGRHALHVYLQTAPRGQTVTSTIALFNDEDFTTEFNGLTPLNIARDREFPDSVIDHIMSRIEKARHEVRE